MRICFYKVIYGFLLLDPKSEPLIVLLNTVLYSKWLCIGNHYLTTFLWCDCNKESKCDISGVLPRKSYFPTMWCVMWTNYVNYCDIGYFLYFKGHLMVCIFHNTACGFIDVDIFVFCLLSCFIYYAMYAKGCTTRWQKWYVEPNAYLNMGLRIWLLAANLYSLNLIDYFYAKNVREKYTLRTTGHKILNSNFLNTIILSCTPSSGEKVILTIFYYRACVLPD